MGGLSPIHWVLVLLVVLLLFGSGKVSSLMGDVAKGIKSFKRNMAEDTPDVSMETHAADRPAGSIPPPAPGATKPAASETPVYRG